MRMNNFTSSWLSITAKNNSMTICHQFIAKKSTVLVRMSLMFLLLLCVMTASAQQVEVTLTEAGTLSEKIASDQKYEITSLKVSGPINGTDVRYLREMAGRDYDDKMTDGKLVDLDLADADIVEGGGNYQLSSYTENYTIGKNMFYACKLENIRIPNSTKIIDSYAFSSCKNLISVPIPNSVTSICYHAFASCTSLASITIPRSVTTVGGYAFYQCIKLDSLIIEDGDSALYLRGYYALPSSTKKFYLGRDLSGDTPSFSGKLVDVTIGSKVTTINDELFSDCRGLTSLTIPKSVKNIGKCAFEWCYNVDTLILEDGDSILNLGGRMSLPPVNKKLYLGRNLLGSSISGGSLTEATLGPKVTSIIDYLFSSCSSLASVTILGSVKSIGNYAFRGCSSLASFVIPDSVTSIGNHAFDGCSSLSSVSFPCSVKNIGEETFRGCSQLTTLTIPNTIDSIGNKAFEDCDNVKTLILEDGDSILYTIYGCMPDSITTLYLGRNLSASPSFGENLKEVTIGPKVTSINNWLFSYCSGLHSVIIANSVKSIGNYAFYKCSGLTSVKNSNTLKSIGDYAFYECSGLTTVTIPNTVTSIGQKAYTCCSNVEELILEDGDSVLNLSNWSCLPCAYDYKDPNPVVVKKLYLGRDLYVNSGWRSNFSENLIEATIGPKVTTIMDCLFEECSNLSSVTIGNSVTNIGKYAFCGCSSLDSIFIPNSVKSIGECAFSCCSGLTSISIPNSVTSIGGSAFYKCSNVETLILEDGDSVLCLGDVASLPRTGADSFYYEPSPIKKLHLGRDLSGATPFFGPNLKEATIGSKVTSLQDELFYCCYDLASITIPNSVTCIGDSTFWGCKDLGSISIPTSVTSIGKEAFGWCINLYSIKIPDFVTSISDYTFKNCTGLKYITIPNGLKSIGKEAFHSCKGLNSFTLPDSLISIGYGAFYGCHSLDSMIIPKLVTYINDNTFYNCWNMSFVSIPNSVTTIGKSAFNGCSKLTFITIPSSVEQIYNEAFAYCVYLDSISIPNTVKYIDSKTFYKCYRLSSITIPSSVQSIGSYAFSGCSNLSTITLPSSLTRIGEYAFEGCSSMVKLTSLNATPPSCGTKALNDINKWHCTLHVPENSASAYKSAYQWMEFNSIEGFDPTGILFPESNGTSKIVKRYDSNGRLMDKPFKGLNILKMSDGTTRKVIVK